MILFGAKQLGRLQLIAVQADVDHRVDVASRRVDFSFADDDDGHPCSGRGWAVLGDDDVLRGHLFLHLGDDSAFTAERVDLGRRRR